MKSPIEIVDLMMAKDNFSQWLGIEIIEIHKGSCILQCKIEDAMVNGFHIAHGGIAYSLADSALAFSSNSYGVHCFSIQTEISHLSKVKVGDILTANCQEIHRGNKTGVYQVVLSNQDNKQVAHFKGTVFISSEEW